MKNRVCHITTVHQPFDVRIFHKECTSLAKNSFDVYLIARHDRDEIVNDINIVAIQKNVPKGFGRIINMWNAFKKAKKLKAKIYHLHDPELLPLGILIKLFTGAKIIYDAHEDPKQHALYQEGKNKYLRFLYANFIGFLEWFCEKFYNFVIVVLETHRQRFMSKTVILHNYPIVEIKENSEEKTHHPIRLIYAGGVRKERAIIEILQSMVEVKKRIPDVKLDLIGDFIPASFENTVRKIIKDYNLEENVIIYGKIPFTNVSKHIENSTVGFSLVHNYDNALPTKIFEYLIMKKPVIVTNVPITKKLVYDNQCGFAVDPKNPGEIANAVLSLLEDEKKRKEMGENGYKTVLNNFNWYNEEKKLIECYNNLLKI